MIKEAKEEGLYLNRTFLAALLALCLAVMGAAAKAYVDVGELKVRVDHNAEKFGDIKEDIKEMKQDIKTLLSRE